MSVARGSAKTGDCDVLVAAGSIRKAVRLKGIGRVGWIVSQGLIDLVVGCVAKICLVIFVEAVIEPEGDGWDHNISLVIEVDVGLDKWIDATDIRLRRNVVDGLGRRRQPADRNLVIGEWEPAVLTTWLSGIALRRTGCRRIIKLNR